MRIGHVAAAALSGHPVDTLLPSHHLVCLCPWGCFVGASEEGVIFALGAAIRSNGTPPNDNIIRDKHVYLYWRMSTVGWLDGG